MPQPWGGKWPQVMADLDQDELYARGLAPQGIKTAINAQSLIIADGTLAVTGYFVLSTYPDLGTGRGVLVGGVTPAAIITRCRAATVSGEGLKFRPGR